MCLVLSNVVFHVQILCDVLRSDGSLYHIHDADEPQEVQLYMSCPDLLYAAEAPTARFGSGCYCNNCSLRARID